MRMTLQRRLVVGVGTISCLLCLYILSLNMQWPLSWSSSRILPVITSQLISRSSLPPHLPPTPSPHPISVGPTPALKTKVLQQVLNQNPGLSNSSSSSDSEKRTTVRASKAAGPTEPPYIGDSYMSDDSSLQTNCLDGIRSRIKKSDFGGRFLEHIPVLQWIRHVTPEQYQRLKRYPGTHGWGVVDYETLVETVSVLDSPANREMLDDWELHRNKSDCSRCAVVGNGGILSGSNKGKEIDGHHYVFRTNGAVVRGFEEDVGSRTTHYIFSTNTMVNSMRSYAGAGYRGPPVSQETRYVFLPDHDRDYMLLKAAATHIPVDKGPERGRDPTKYFGKDVSAKKLKMYHPDFIRYLRNRFLRSGALKTKYKNLYRPSTGATMLLAALHTCDQVSAYGFMTPDYKSYSDHYFDKNFHPVGFFINHDLHMEMNLWQQLHKAGLIQLYMR